MMSQGPPTPDPSIATEGGRRPRCYQVPGSLRSLAAFLRLFLLALVCFFLALMMNPARSNAGPGGTVAGSIPAPWANVLSPCITPTARRAVLLSGLIPALLFRKSTSITRVRAAWSCRRLR